MRKKRTDRLNSLLKEVISEVIVKDLNNPKITSLITIISVDIAPDLHQAKVYINVIGPTEKKEETLKLLNAEAGYIGICSSKKVSLRYFPNLQFYIDTSLDKQLRIEEILQDIHKNDPT